MQCFVILLLVGLIVLMPPLLLEYVIESWLAFSGRPADVSFWLVWATWIIICWAFKGLSGRVSE